MDQLATIEIFRNGNWVPAATLSARTAERGIYGETRFEYIGDYALEQIAPEYKQAAAVSCRYPVDFDIHYEPRWPPFVLDILPNGYGREQWLRKLELKDGAEADWPLLLNGAAFPPGNLRVAEAVAAKRQDIQVPTSTGESILLKDHPGFAREDVLNRNEHFLEYAFLCGIYAAGSTDVQGVAPKVLLAETHDGRWHAEGVLTDDQVRCCWLAKRPRGNKENDRTVLRNEAAYMRVARELGLNVYADLTWAEDTLLIPRFDRIYNKGVVDRLGMESLCSLAGVAEYGERIPHEVLCESLMTYSSDPAADLLEYIKRDVLNVCLGNKDNHARNTSVLKWTDGKVRLAPLYDFAPMYLDPEGIVRTCRWHKSREQVGNPDWQAIIEHYAKQLPDASSALRAFGLKIRRLPEITKEAGVDIKIIEHHAAVIQRNAEALVALKGI